jgi:hypothetical protein
MMMDKYTFGYEATNSGAYKVTITLEQGDESLTLTNTLAFSAQAQSLTAMQSEAIENTIELLASHLAKVKTQNGSD